MNILTQADVVLAQDVLIEACGPAADDKRPEAATTRLARGYPRNPWQVLASKGCEMV